MFNRILLPLDGSALAERAIAHAVEFARIFESALILLRVLEVDSHQEKSLPVNPLTWQIQKMEAEVYLREIAARIRRQLNLPEDDSSTEHGMRVEYAIREGRAAENIIDFANSEEIDLIIISSHGMGGLSRWNMSSITQKVVELAYLPVLVVRSYHVVEDEVAAIRYRNILLPIDSSRRAGCVLSAGIIMAQKDQVNDESEGEGDRQPTKLILAAVVTQPEIPIPTPYPPEINELSERLLKTSRKAVHAYLEEMMDHMNVPCETRVVESNNISSAIQEMAEHEEIDLVIMSAHGYTGQFTHPYGSITRNCIDHGSKPILVIQDVPKSQVRPTAASVAAEKLGRR